MCSLNSGVTVLLQLLTVAIDLNSFCLSSTENDLAMPTRYQRLACVQRWIEGSWPSIEERSLEKPAEERNVGRGLKADAGGTNWFTPYAFRHPTSLSAKEWGKILDTQLCR